MPASIISSGPTIFGCTLLSFIFIKLVQDAVPPHIKKAQHKRNRFLRMIPKLVMKSQMYSNYRMLSQSGELLAIISEKKASWYVRKHLASYASSTSIQLNFLEKASGPSFIRAPKTNSCVRCRFGSANSGYMRHFIVPKCYRQLFPKKFKSHLSHDIVLVCPGCHIFCGQATDFRMHELDRKFRDPNVKERIVDASKNEIRSYANALISHKLKIPPQVVRKYEEKIAEFYGESMSPELLARASGEDKFGAPNPVYVQHNQLIYANLCKNEGDIGEFVKGWRRHFVDDAQPRNLPEGWGVDTSVTNDRS
ncbi:hypothetical protein ScalyP_jg8262 [Parmales sp. scaly parma]|nr:hypothetical protein ScalyP_jg8262 [Parmales sp. scaly parma]